MAAQTCFSGCCLPLKQLLSGPTPRTGGAVPDCSPWGPSREVDLIPSHDRPRVGSWASPVPSMPAPWGTWEMVEGDLELRETPPAGTVTHLDGKPRRISRDAIAGAQPGRLQEIGISRTDSPSNFMWEQLLSSPGSLPQGLTEVECQKQTEKLVDKALATMPKAVGERLAKAPRRLLVQRSLQGQRLRRGILRGATLAFITTGYEGKRFIYEKAYELGVRIVVIDSPDSWSRKLVEEKKAVKFIPVDMMQSSSEVVKSCLAALEACEQDPVVGKIDGVCTFAELSVPLTARLAELLGLPGPLTSATDQARDKSLTRLAMRHNGLPTPPVHEIRSDADVEPAARRVGFPAVLKPVSGAASVGVKKVNSLEELQATYQARHKELGSLVVSSGNIVKDDGSSGGKAINAESVIGARFLLESYLDGDEVDVDVIMSDGEWQFAAVSDNGPTLEPYFNETWAVSPSLLPRKKQVELRELAVNSVKALGFQDGIFHVELKYTTSHGAQLIEVNARMGGGPVYATNLRTWGVDLVEEALFCAAGIPSRPMVPRLPIECIANADVNALCSGRLMDLNFMKPLLNRKGVISHNCHVSAGEEVVGPKEGLPTWLVEVVVSKGTPREALDFLLKLEEEVQGNVHVS